MADYPQVNVVGPLLRHHSIATVLRELALALHEIGVRVTAVNTDPLADHPSYAARLRHLLVEACPREGIAVTYAGHEQAAEIPCPKARYQIADDWQATTARVAEWNRDYEVLLAPSRHSAEFLRQQGANDVEVVPHGYHPRLLGRPQARWTPGQRAVLRKFQWVIGGPLNEGTTIFGHYGYLQPRKGTSELLEAWGDFRRRDDVALLIHGPKINWGQEIGRQLAELAGRRLPPLAYCSEPLTPRELGALRSLLSAGVFPSYLDGFNLCAYDCLASGLPIIAPDHSGFQEYIAAVPEACRLTEFSEEPVSDVHLKEDLGLNWYRPSVDELVERMVHVAEQKVVADPAGLPDWPARARALADALGVSVARRPADEAVTVGLLTCGRLDQTERAMASARRSRVRLPLKLLVVDNGLPAEDKPALAALAARYKATLLAGDASLADPKRLGLIQRQQILEKCETTYVVSLDADAWLEPETLQRALDYLEAHPEVAMVGPKSLLPSGAVDHAGAYIEGNGGRHVGMDQADCPGYAVNRPVRYIPGLCQIWRAAALLGSGGYDVAFAPIWCDDVDPCYAARANGWEVHLLGTAVVHHEPHSSSKEMMREVAGKVEVLRGKWQWLLDEEEAHQDPPRL